MRRTLVTLASALTLALGPATAASAFEPVDIVHTEQVQAGPYAITVGFSTWPVRANQSLDFTFVPEGGIAGKSGELDVVGAEGTYTEPLVRHPRKLEVWGLDVQALPAPGDWTLRFTVDGPKGKGVGELSTLHVLERPGPPIALSWGVSALPLFGLIALIVVAWRNTSRTGGDPSAPTPGPTPGPTQAGAGARVSNGATESTPTPGGQDHRPPDTRPVGPPAN